MLDEGVIGLIAPLQDDKIFGQFADELGLLAQHVAPALHGVPPLGHQAVDLFQKVEIDPLLPLGFTECGRAA